MKVYDAAVNQALTHFYQQQQGCQQTSENQMAVLRQASLSLSPTLLFFAYGSQMWKPNFRFITARRATIPSFQREYCVQGTIYRGTPEQPGLALAAVEHEPASLDGIAYEIEWNELPAILQQEMINGVYLPLWVQSSCKQQMLLFVANTANPRILNLPLEQQADLISTAKGIRGTCLEYFDNTFATMTDMGITCNYSSRLNELLTPLR